MLGTDLRARYAAKDGVFFAALWSERCACLHETRSPVAVSTGR